MDEPKYLAAAQRAARYVLANRMRDGRLMRTETVPAMVEDYAFFANGLVDLYETDFDPQWLLKAVELSDTMLKLFYDPKDGGFFQTDGRDASVLVRSKEDYDGAEPSGNSMATLLLLRLAQFSDDGVVASVTDAGKQPRTAAATTIARRRRKPCDYLAITCTKRRRLFRKCSAPWISI